MFNRQLALSSHCYTGLLVACVGFGGCAERPPSIAEPEASRETREVTVSIATRFPGASPIAVNYRGTHGSGEGASAVALHVASTLGIDRNLEPLLWAPPDDGGDPNSGPPPPSVFTAAQKRLRSRANFYLDSLVPFTPQVIAGIVAMLPRSADRWPGAAPSGVTEVEREQLPRYAGQTLFRSYWVDSLGRLSSVYLVAAGGNVIATSDFKWSATDELLSFAFVTGSSAASGAGFFVSFSNDGYTVLSSRRMQLLRL